jgi:hypothetical protein
MEQLTTAQIVEIFCEIDEFCKVYENYCQKNLGRVSKQLKSLLSPPPWAGEKQEYYFLKRFLL